MNISNSLDADFVSFMIHIHSPVVVVVVVIIDFHHMMLYVSLQSKTFEINLFMKFEEKRLCKRVLIRISYQKILIDDLAILTECSLPFYINISDFQWPVNCISERCIPACKIILQNVCSM